MNIKRVKIYYWTTLVLSIIILLSNFGLALMVLGIIILPVIVLHIIIGLRIDKIKAQKTSIFISATTLLFFSLIRPDGVHTFNDTGLSSILEKFGIIWGDCYSYENYYLFASLTILLFQIIIEIRLMRYRA